MDVVPSLRAGVCHRDRGAVGSRACRILIKSNTGSKSRENSRQVGIESIKRQRVGTLLTLSAYPSILQIIDSTGGLIGKIHASFERRALALISVSGASVSGRMPHPISIPFAKTYCIVLWILKILAGNAPFKQNWRCIKASSGYFSIWKR